MKCSGSPASGRVRLSSFELDTGFAATISGALRAQTAEITCRELWSPFLAIPAQSTDREKVELGGVDLAAL